MKKLVQWVLSAFLGIAPALGADWADDPFLNQPGFTYQIAGVFEDEVEGKMKLSASVKATSPANEITRRRIPAAFTPTGWHHSDPLLSSTRQGIAYILCNDEKIEKPYEKAERHPYELLQESIVNLMGGVSTPDEALPLGVKISVATQKDFKRPGGSIYKLLSEHADAVTVATLVGGDEDKKILPEELLDLPSGTVLNVYLDRGAGAADRRFIYQLLIKENSVAKGTIYQCFQEGEEWQQRGLNRYRQLRHWWKHFNGIEVTRAAYRVVGGIETPVLGLSKSELQLSTLKTEGGRENHAECPAPYGRNLPPNSRIVG
ncbi:MAG: hypothetical protein K0R76_507 [Alphaproteobacteria bacterium]|jgi:hypothetical protein|nr:hypothetical protein [Alphaproteobacteria bacterium]